jgi:hypothetical protein
MITQHNTQPWPHWIVDDFLTPACLQELKSIPHSRPQQHDGRRVGSDRLFIDQTNQVQYPQLWALYQSLESGAAKKYFEQHTGIDYTGLTVRVEVISDIGDFYLEPHHDHLEKRLTALVYTDHERLWPGTQLSDGSQVESRDNRCFFFVPSELTYHEYPLTHFDCVRRALQINYWTYSV